MGKVIYPRKGEVHTAPVTTLPNFADNTWKQIITACETNTVPETWVVGDQKTMTINGTDYPIDIIGKNHDTYASGGTAPLTFQMHDCYGTTYPMNSSATNVGGWTNCAMRNTHLPAILALMPSEVQAGIKEVNKLTSAGNKSSTINTTADKLFLIAECEHGGATISTGKFGEGSQYAYYAAGNSHQKNLNGSKTTWWCRSPSSTNTTNFCGVPTTSSFTNQSANSSLGVAFAFCF